jgi:hypothetical protein
LRAAARGADCGRGAERRSRPSGIRAANVAGEETVFAWTPPEIALAEDEAAAELPTQEAREEELDDTEIDLLEKAPVLAWLRDTIQTRLSLAEAISGKALPAGRIVFEPSRPRPHVDRGVMAAYTHELVARLARTQSLKRQQIVRELGRQAIARIHVSLHEGDAEALERSTAAAESFWDMR